METQLFNYKVLTDSVTNEQFYCLDKQELVAIVQENTKETAAKSFTSGYYLGCSIGLIYAAILFLGYKLIKNNLARRNKKHLLTDSKNNN